MCVCLCVCLCVCVRVRARAGVCVCVCKEHCQDGTRKLQLALSIDLIPL